MGVEVSCSRPGLEFSVEEGVGEVLFEKIGWGSIEVMECVKEAEVSWGVGDFVLGHACGFEEGVGGSHRGEGFCCGGEWIGEVVADEGGGDSEASGVWVGDDS